MMLTLLLAGALVIAGLSLLAHESRRGVALTEADDENSAFLARQVRRRIRIAVMICVLGLLMGVGGWIDPQRRPIAFVGSWLAVALAALWLLWLAALDFFAARLHWSDQFHRNRADIAKARADLKAIEKAHNGVIPPAGPQGN